MPTQDTRPKKRQRRTTSHRGVTLIQRTMPSGKTVWRARWKDPESGRLVFQTLDALGVRTAEERAEWARQRAKALLGERASIASGAERAPAKTIRGAVEDYLENGKGSLRPATLEIYAESLARLVEWARAAHIEETTALDGPKLVAFSTYVRKIPKLRAQKHGRRGAKGVAAETRGARTIARDLRQVGGFLRDCLRRGLTPKLSKDTITDSLRPPRAEKKLVQFCSSSDCRKLLEAALRHDAETFKITREEHALGRTPGTTPRFPQVAPAVVLALLTGMRRGELAELRWGDVDLHALGEGGRAVGTIRVRSAVAKTGQERLAFLDHSPACRALLGALKLRAGSDQRVLGMSLFELESAGKRLRASYGAPAGSGWHALRRTCGTFCANAVAVFGASSAWRAARLLGHSVAISERHYLGVVHPPRGATTLEDAMEIADLVAKVIERVAARSGEVESAVV